MPSLEVEREHCDFCWPKQWQAARDLAETAVRTDHPDLFVDPQDESSWPRSLRISRREELIWGNLEPLLKEIPVPQTVCLSVGGESPEDTSEVRWIHACRRCLEEALRLIDAAPGG